jgi:hypothetical protein
MDLFDTLTWVEILLKTTFLGTPTLTVLNISFMSLVSQFLMPISFVQTFSGHNKKGPIQMPYIQYAEMCKRTKEQLALAQQLGTLGHHEAYTGWGIRFIEMKYQDANNC